MSNGSIISFYPYNRQIEGTPSADFDRTGAVGQAKGSINDQANAGEREAEELREEFEAALAQDHYTRYFARCV